MSTPTSPRPPRDHHANYTTSFTVVEHSPYHELALLAAAISATTSSLVETHQTFIGQQGNVYATGITLQSVFRDVKAGMEVESLALDTGDDEEVIIAGEHFNSAQGTTEDRKTHQKSHAGLSHNGKRREGSSVGAAVVNAGSRTVGKKNKRGTANIHEVNNSRGVSETDPIVID